MSLITLEKIKKELQFVSVFRTKQDSNNLYGVVVNSDKNTISIIDLERIHDKKLILEFLVLGQKWWETANRAIPINLFYPTECSKYMKYVTHISTKSVDKLFGHESSLTEYTITRRSPRKNKMLIVTSSHN